MRTSRTLARTPPGRRHWALLLSSVTGLAALVLCATAGAQTLPNGQEIAERGLGPDVPACSSCHGTHFEGDPAKGGPALAGRDAALLMDELFALGADPKDQRPMALIARHLNMAERAAVTVWLSNLSKRP